jgi:biotin carboxyl carrier protein
MLLALGRSFALVVPDGVSGVVMSPAPERVRQPVGYGDVLYELAPLDSQESSASKHDDDRGANSKSTALVVRAHQSGRYYQRPAPGEPTFISTGAEIADGTPIGLIEVMKTFTHVVYRSSASLPARAKVLRLVAGDGVDVRQGDVLIELAPL